MNSHPQNSDNILHRFEKWLLTDRVQPKADFLARTRHRLQKSSAYDVDDVIDELLKPDYSLRNPSMAARVRERMQESDRKISTIPWFQWATPLAAAAVLGFAFFAFQSNAPVSGGNLDDQQTPVATYVQGTPPDSELTQIFALASNLEATTDLSRLQSVDNYAFLLE